MIGSSWAKLGHHLWTLLTWSLRRQTNCIGGEYSGGGYRAKAGYTKTPLGSFLQVWVRRCTIVLSTPHPSPIILRGSLLDPIIKDNFDANYDGVFCYKCRIALTRQFRCSFIPYSFSVYFVFWQMSQGWLFPWHVFSISWIRVKRLNCKHIDTRWKTRQLYNMIDQL